LRHLSQNPAAIYQRRHRAKYPDKVIKQNRSPATRKAIAEWGKRNREKCRENSRRWREKNVEYVSAKNRKWDLENPGRRCAIVARRNAMKIRATPAWADLEAIADFYAACPPGFHVDHQVPLNSPRVCGLHVRCNLQYLPAQDNLRKGNRFECDT
jgi:hypothetical protein